MSTTLSAPAETSPDDAPGTAAPEVVGPERGGEIPLRFPVLVMENMDTSDGRFLAAGSLTHRALPIPLLAQPESAHGGNEPGPAGIVGRIDTLTRTPGPEVISPRTGEPFPDGTFVWSGTGVLAAAAKVGVFDVADLFRRRFLRGVSVDLAGMDYETIGDGGMAADPEHPRRQMIAHAAEIAAATLVCIPAMADAYAEIADDADPTTPAALDDLPEGLAASAFPAWRSAEVGDYPALVASAEPWPAGVPADAVEQIAAVITDDGGEQRDASELAAAIVEFIATQWASGDTDRQMPDEDMADVPGHEGSIGPGPDQYAEPHVYARDPQSGAGNCVCGAPESDPLHADVTGEMAAETEPDVNEVGMPDAPQPCEFGDHPAVRSLLYDNRKQYAATCQEHDEWARSKIADFGFEVDEVVDIQPADDTEEAVA